MADQTPPPSPDQFSPAQGRDESFRAQDHSDTGRGANHSYRLNRVHRRQLSHMVDDVLVPSLDSIGAGAPAAEIEITPEMIEAGICVLWESGAIETPMEDFNRELVQKIFVAMSHALTDRSSQ